MSESQGEQGARAIGVDLGNQPKQNRPLTSRGCRLRYRKSLFRTCLPPRCAPLRRGTSPLPSVTGKCCLGTGGDGSSTLCHMSPPPPCSPRHTNRTPILPPLADPSVKDAATMRDRLIGVPAGPLSEIATSAEPRQALMSADGPVVLCVRRSRRQVSPCCLVMQIRGVQAGDSSNRLMQCVGTTNGDVCKEIVSVTP